MTRLEAYLLQGTLDLLILKSLSLGPGGKQFTTEEESRDRLALASAKVRKAV